MGMVTDIVLAVFVLLFGLYIAYKFGITLSDFELYIKHFFGYFTIGGFK